MEMSILLMSLCMRLVNDGIYCALAIANDYKMKKILSLFFAFIALTSTAQEISMTKATADDYIKILNNQGLYVYALDLSNMEKDKYLMAPVIQVYINGKLKEDILSDFGIAYTNSASRITIGFYSKCDSLLTFKFQFDEVCGLSFSLPKYPIRDESDGTESIMYKPTPFVIQPTWKEHEVIPVVAYSSFWYDPEDKICRNCDERVFGANYLNSNTFKHSPHIYVFGIKIWKM